MDVLSYHVFDGHKWLADDRRTWTSKYHFDDPKLAQIIGECAAGDVMDCFGWQS